MTAEAPSTLRGADGKRRCTWAASDDHYIEYHDGEWGRPIVDDAALYEKLCLEGFQCGLSWITILRRREAFRRAFADFIPETVAAYGERDVERLLGDASIIRHRGKIESAIKNAQALLALHEAEGPTALARIVWSVEPTRRSRPKLNDLAEVPDVTPESTELSKELKRRGFRFIGPTTAYAMMQSVGVVNDHVQGCHVRVACDRDRRSHPSVVG